MGRILRIACRRPIALAALKVAAVVGLLLNAINQGGRILQGDAPQWGQLLLNFVVPYCVSSYSAALNEWRRRGGTE